MSLPWTLRRDRIFETSGSTGPPRRWIRTEAQLVREVELIGDTLVGPVDVVVNYAPPHHLFGALFGEELPRLRGIPSHPAWDDPFTFPHVEAGARLLVVCVPMAWELMRRHWTALAAADSIVALHSSAAVPPTAHALLGMTRQVPLCAHEILGTTETGGIAHRLIAPDGDVLWQVFDDVELVPADVSGSGSRELVVRSPRLARPEDRPAPPDTWVTGDLVRLRGPGTFELVGRSGSLVKVNGRRVHLAEVDECLGRRLPEAWCVPVPLAHDPVAGEGYAVVWSGRRPGIGLSDVRSALRGFPSPSRIVELPEIPTTATGKPDRQALIALLHPCPDQGSCPDRGEGNARVP